MKALKNSTLTSLTALIFIIAACKSPAPLEDLALYDFKVSDYTAVGFEASDKTEGSLGIKKVDMVKRDNSHFTLSIPQFSFVKVTLRK